MGLDDTVPPITTGPILIDKDGVASVHYSIQFKNFGETPAQGILATAQLMITEDLADITKEQESLFRPNQDKSVGVVLFPRGTGAIVSASMFPSARMKSMTYDHLFEAWLVGSIRYRDKFGNHYRTGFRYWMVEPKNISRPYRFMPRPETRIEMGPFVENGGGGSIT